LELVESIVSRARDCGQSVRDEGDSRAKGISNLDSEISNLFSSPVPQTSRVWARNPAPAARKKKPLDVYARAER
jgi:hypothetical protein